VQKDNKKLKKVPKEHHNFLKLNRSITDPAKYAIEFKKNIYYFIKQALEEEGEINYCKNGANHSRALLYDECYHCLLKNSYVLTHGSEKFQKIKHFLLCTRWSY
jgi:hypothetical protein